MFSLVDFTTADQPWMCERKSRNYKIAWDLFNNAKIWHVSLFVDTTISSSVFKNFELIMARFSSYLPFILKKQTNKQTKCGGAVV